jgi:hypothetical protein
MAKHTARSIHMGYSRSQFKFLSPEDRIVYKQWLRRGSLFYGSLLALLIVAAFVNHVIKPAPSDVAGDMHTAAVSARK